MATNEMTLEDLRNSARKSPQRNLDQFDLEAMKEGNAIRTIRTAVPKKKHVYCVAKIN